jgi:solute carrier family 25 carnitine/acylcarnitine transporter 20/29
MTAIDYNNYYKNFLSGSIAGVSAIIVSHPIDTIKSNIQEKKPIKYNFKFLYRGLTAPLIGVGLEKSIVFGVFETTRKYTGSDVVSGALSGMSASLIVTPFERIKILLQTNQGFSKSNLNFGYLFQGLSATFYRETPGFAIYFATYNYLKEKTINNKLMQNKKSEISLLESFTYGALAGSTAWIFIYPQDRIKTHVQALKDRKLGFTQGFQEILKDGGYRSFYRGFHYALMRAIPLHAMAFTTMELCKKYIY